MVSEFKVIEALERELAGHETRKNRSRMETLFHNDFSEIGKSGRIFDKPTLLDKVPSWEYFDTELSSFTFHKLAEKAIMLKYKSIVGGIKAHRTSIWVNGDNTWQIIHHQGTVCP